MCSIGWGGVVWAIDFIELCIKKTQDPRRDHDQSSHHKHSRIRSVRTSIYHSQVDSLIEQFNQTPKQKSIQEDTQDWDKPYFFKSLLFAIWEILQALTGFSQFELLYGFRLHWKSRGGTIGEKEWIFERSWPESKSPPITAIKRGAFATGARRSILAGFQR